MGPIPWDSAVETGVVLRSLALQACCCAAVKEQFVKEFMITSSGEARRSKHICKAHLLPQEVAAMMKPRKHWVSQTEHNLERAAAAWSWLHRYVELRRAGQLVSAGAARFSKLAQMFTIVVETLAAGGETFYACLGNRLWGALGRPLVEVTVQGESIFKYTPMAPLVFLHIVEPRHWKVLPYKPYRLQGHGLVFRPISSKSFAVPLLVHTLRQGHHKSLSLPKVNIHR